MPVTLSTDIMYLPGVGPKRAELLKREIDVHTLGDLLYLFPFKYVDRSRVYQVKEITGEMPHIQVVGQIVRFQEVGTGPKRRLTALFTDGTGTLELIWFKGIKWVASTYKPRVNYLVFGRPTLFGGGISIAHPELEEHSPTQPEPPLGLQPAYLTTEKLKSSYINSRTILKLQQALHPMVEALVEETLPAHLIERLRLMTLPETLRSIHFPQSNTLLQRARARLKFEELFYVQLGLMLTRSLRQQDVPGHVFGVVGAHFNRFYAHHLPFPLTDAQKRVMREIRRDLGSGRQMNRLLQGDVGSGKTVVALMAMLIAADNGYQSCIMAPTEILAAQHAQSLGRLLDGLPVSVGLLTGSTRRGEREQLLGQLQCGALHIIIGTHALIEDDVQFQNLGLVVIDEQQRFGVAQRAKLWEKSIPPPHMLVMTATPIPRTLAMTVYGDLDVSVIDQLPPGRRPVTTIHYTDTRRNLLFGLMRRQIALGRQVYVVYPLINESESLDYKDLQDGYESIARAFPPPQYTTVVVHGQLSAQEKDQSMRLFASGRAQIMVATTVIEVGVDVPNATVMVIESAERFGLSQLHQLRGRVGRGADESYCVLMSGVKLTSESRRRLQTMVDTHDGFQIAEVDLQLRGPGDMQGTQQSGLPFDFKIANLATDGQVLQWARTVAQGVVEEDPRLDHPKNSLLKARLEHLSAQRPGFARVG